MTRAAGSPAHAAPAEPELTAPPASVAAVRRPGRAEQVGRWLHRCFAAVPMWGRRDLDFLAPGPEAAHTVEPLTIPLGDGTMPGRWFRPRAGTGAAVLFVHGATTEAFAPFYFLIEALVARGIAVMTFEMDGHGENERPFHPERVAENVPAALEVLFKLPGVAPGRVGVLGCSLGGACALNGTAGRSDVRALAAVGTPVRLEIGRRVQWLEALGLLLPQCWPSGLVVAPRRTLSFLTSTVRSAEESGVVHRHVFDLETPRVFARALAHLDPLSQLERLPGVPLLVLTGSWDLIAPPAHSRALHAAAVGPAELVIVPRRNHFSLMLCPFAAKTLADWFARHLEVPARAPEGRA